MVVGPAVDHRWFLCEAQTMDQIDELDVHSKQMQLQLNSWGTVSGWCDLLDPKSNNIIDHQTALRCDRDNEPIWSGPIWKTTKVASTSTGTSSGNAQLQFTAMGWLQTLQRRLIHTGAEFQAMMHDPTSGAVMPNYAAWMATNGAPYVQFGVDEATTLAYSATVLPGTTDAAIIFDLLDRANIDAPTGMTRGAIFGSPVQRNLTLQRLQKVGDQINQLVNVEAGVDIYVDPVTRQLNLYGPGASSSPRIANGLGNDNSGGSVFVFPGNMTTAQEDSDGTETANRIEAVGQYGVGRADDPSSQSVNGLLEDTDSLSDVVDINILIAYANIEVAVRSYPWTTITYTPRAVAPSDAGLSGVPRPFDDFNIGDLVGSRVDYGAFQVGSNATPQSTRIFGFTVNIDDGGVEKLSSISTTYQGLSS